MILTHTSAVYMCSPLNAVLTVEVKNQLKYSIVVYTTFSYKVYRNKKNIIKIGETILRNSI